MKVTKYPQSCLLIEKDGKRIVIDPGSFFAAKYKVSELGPVEAVLYTHEHSDHFDQFLAQQFVETGAKLYANFAIKKLAGDVINEVKNGEEFEIAGFKILPHDIEHFPIGQPVPQNTGYIIDGIFFHPGDGYKNNGARADNFAVPIAGAFSFDDANQFIKAVGAKQVIPIHYSNQERYPVDPTQFIEQTEKEFEVILLDDGESTEL